MGQFLFIKTSSLTKFYEKFLQIQIKIVSEDKILNSLYLSSVPLVFVSFKKTIWFKWSKPGADPSTMHHTNVIGISLLFAAFFLEFILILLHKLIENGKRYHS
jgi:hypothetical protein